MNCKKISFLAAGILAAPVLALSQPTLTEIAIDNFDGSGFVDADAGDGLTVTYDALIKNPPDVDANNSTWEDNFDYSTLTGPAIAQPTGDTLADGFALRVASNNVDGDPQEQFQTFDPGTADYAVETNLLALLQDANSGGGTTFSGIGVRIQETDSGNDTFESGYYLEMRPDNSSTFGNYVSFLKRVDGTDVFLGRYYFATGSNGVQEFNDDTTDPAPPLVSSALLRDPEEANTNQWIPIRLVAIGDQISLYVEDLGTPVASFTDPAPISTGKGVLRHFDAFGSLTDPADSSGGLFEYVRVLKADPPTDASGWNMYE